MGGDDTDSGSDSEDVAPRRRRRRRGPPILPKNLSYDGRGNFSAFRQKFEMYARAYNWNPNNCKNCLCWSLTGKASDFYLTITERDATMTYDHIILRLEKRFGEKDLDETAQVRFHQAIQQPNESLDDWADRVMNLANRALWDLPERHVSRQAVLRFCQGLSDIDAGQDVCIRRPNTMEDAIDHVKLYQNIHDMMRDGKAPRKSRNPPQDPEVYETTYTPVPKGPKKDGDPYATLTTQIEKLTAEMQHARLPGPQVQLSTPPSPPGPWQRGPQQPVRFPPPRYQNQQRPPFIYRGGDVCFQCGQGDHWKKDCPLRPCYGCGHPGHPRSRCPQALNGNGSRGQADPRPQ